MATAIGYVRVSPPTRLTRCRLMPSGNGSRHGALPTVSLSSVFVDGDPGKRAEPTGATTLDVVTSEGGTSSSTRCPGCLDRLVTTRPIGLTVMVQTSSLSERIDTTTAAGKMVVRMMAVMPSLNETSSRADPRRTLPTSDPEGGPAGAFASTRADGVQFVPNADEQRVLSG